MRPILNSKTNWRNIMENQTTKKSTMIHKENEWEWKFVGIWADMIKDTGLAENYYTFTLFSYRYSGAMSNSLVHITV